MVLKTLTAPRPLHARRGSERNPAPVPPLLPCWRGCNTHFLTYLLAAALAALLAQVQQIRTINQAAMQPTAHDLDRRQTVNWSGNWSGAPRESLDGRGGLERSHSLTLGASHRSRPAEIAPPPPPAAQAPHRPRLRRRCWAGTATQHLCGLRLC